MLFLGLVDWYRLSYALFNLIELRSESFNQPLSFFAAFEGGRWINVDVT